MPKMPVHYYTDDDRNIKLVVTREYTRRLPAKRARKVDEIVYRRLKKDVAREVAAEHKASETAPLRFEIARGGGPIERGRRNPSVREYQAHISAIMNLGNATRTAKSQELAAVGRLIWHDRDLTLRERENLDRHVSFLIDALRYANNPRLHWVPLLGGLAGLGILAVMRRS